MSARAMRSATPLGRSQAEGRAPSPSIALLREGLGQMGVSRRAFVEATGLSYEYVSRIFNNKVRFPSVRETLERFAEVAGLDPMDFVEYQELVSHLPASTRMLWARMAELGLGRQGFAAKVSLSRTYLYEILRGDVPFPRNPEVIEKIALALNWPPEQFEEYLAPVEDWAERNPAAIEQVFLNLAVGKMLVSRGHAPEDFPGGHLGEAMLQLFPPAERYEPWLQEAFRAMGARRWGVRQLAAACGRPEREIRLLVMGQVASEDLPETAVAMRLALDLG